MKDLNVSEFKSRLAHYLREVKAGETLVITEYRQPIAEVRRIDTGQPIALPAARPFSLEDSRPSRPVARLAMEVLNEDRGEQ